MTKTIELQVEKRDTNVKAEKLRAQNLVPGIVYGPADEPVAVQFPVNEFLRVWHEAGESTIIDLKGLDEEKEVLIKEVQMHPVKDLPLHVDFYAIERGKTLTLTVPLEFEGEAPAEKLGGIVVKVMHELEVECRPRNIPQHLTVDLSLLEDMDSVIKVSDVATPEGVEILTDKEEIVASVAEQQEEPQEEAAEAEAQESAEAAEDTQGGEE